MPAEGSIAAEPQSPAEPAQAQNNKPAAEDFAAALETFTTEAEEAVGEARVIRGTVLKLTPTHGVVDIGAKSAGMLRITEVLDHEGNPRFQPGDEIDGRRDNGEAEERCTNLAHPQAQGMRARDEA